MEKKWVVVDVLLVFKTKRFSDIKVSYRFNASNRLLHRFHFKETAISFKISEVLRDFPNACTHLFYGISYGKERCKFITRFGHTLMIE